MLNVGEILSSGASLKVVYGLGFMFFTLLMASVSDLRKLTIKAEFVSTWLGFSLLMFAYDYFNYEYVWWKWFLIVLLGILSWRGTGKIFSLARADVVAISAVCSVLEIPYIVLFYIILLVTNAIAIYPLKFFRRGNKYPFMPVILLSLVILILILGIVNLHVIFGALGF